MTIHLEVAAGLCFHVHMPFDVESVLQFLNGVLISISFANSPERGEHKHSCHLTDPFDPLKIF